MEIQEITKQKFKEIYINEKLRNEIAYAHQCCDKNGTFLHFSTCSYPIRYIVTESQIKEAKELKNKNKLKVLKKHSNNLLFVAMGGTYDAKYKDDVCNHRIRTEFINSSGQRFFIEVGTSAKSNEMIVSFSIDRDLENKYKRKLNIAFNERKKHKRSSIEFMRANTEVEKWQSQPFYNYKDLERSMLGIEYTNANLLNFVNKYFNCNFANIVIDEFNISCDDVICKSPKSERQLSLSI